MEPAGQSVQSGSPRLCRRTGALALKEVKSCRVSTLPRSGGCFQLLSRVTPWTAVPQVPLSSTLPEFAKIHDH